MELELDVMIEIYMIFSKFEIDIPQEDYDQVDSLKLNFKNMIDHAKAIGDQIANMRESLFEELTKGIEVLKNDINIFNEEFETKGPMIDGLTAKVASDRVSEHFVFRTNHINHTDHIGCRRLYFKVVSKTSCADLRHTKVAKRYLVSNQVNIRF